MLPIHNPGYGAGIISLCVCGVFLALFMGTHMAPMPMYFVNLTGWVLALAGWILWAHEASQC